MLPSFVSVTLSGLVRISKTRYIKTRYIFADVVAYQFINFNSKLNGSREECTHHSIWVVYDPSRPKRVNT